MRIRNAILISIFLVMLAGCAAGPDFEQPDVEVPEYYRTTDLMPADSIINLNWWELFKDPILDTLVTIALRENKDIGIAASRIEEARAYHGFTRADLYPGLDVDGGASRGNYFGGIRTDSEVNNFYIAALLTWEIDFWGKFRRASEAAKADMIASEYAYRTIQIGLISEVVSTYFLLLDYKQRLEISSHTLESRLKSLDIIQKRFNEGIIPEIDLNQSQIQKEIAEAAIPMYERHIALTENTLSILLGRLPHEIETGFELGKQTIPPDIPVGLPSSLMMRRPDIAQAEYALMAQNARIGVASAMRFPAISLTGILGLASDDLSELTSEGAAWSVSGSLFGPLFHFNKYRRNVDIEEERTRQALLAYERTVLVAFKEVEDALVEIKTYREQISSVTRKFKAAKNAADLSKERYDKGVTSYLEVLETERTLFSVELELSELQQLYHKAYVKLYKALGGGWISREEMEAAEEFQKNSSKNQDNY
jgi:multidrug efflux system outer membrane protein